MNKLVATIIHASTMGLYIGLALIALLSMHTIDLSFRLYNFNSFYSCVSDSILLNSTCTFNYSMTSFTEFPVVYLFIAVFVVHILFNCYYVLYVNLDHGKAYYVNDVRHLENLIAVPAFVCMVCLLCGMRQMYLLSLFIVFQMILETLTYIQFVLFAKAKSTRLTLLSPYVFSSIPTVGMWIAIIIEFLRLSTNTGATTLPFLYQVQVFWTAAYILFRKIFEPYTFAAYLGYDTPSSIDGGGTKPTLGELYSGLILQVVYETTMFMMFAILSLNFESI